MDYSRGGERGQGFNIDLCVPAQPPHLSCGQALPPSLPELYRSSDILTNIGNLSSASVLLLSTFAFLSDLN